MTLPQEIQIYGRWRPTRNSEGRLIHSTLEGVYNFWKWFGGSEVVDDQERPLVVYHGTRKSFSSFQAGPSGMVGQGIYLTPDPSEASYYATKQGQVYPVYVSIQFPKVLASARQGVDHFFDTLGNYTGETPDAYVTSVMKGQGHDGVFVYKDLGSGLDLRELVAFSPTQIKSATGNRGTFDPEDPVLTNPPKRRNNPRRVLYEEKQVGQYRLIRNFETLVVIVKGQTTEVGFGSADKAAAAFERVVDAHTLVQALRSAGSQHLGMPPPGKTWQAHLRCVADFDHLTFEVVPLAPGIHAVVGALLGDHSGTLTGQQLRFATSKYHTRESVADWLRANRVPYRSIRPPPRRAMRGQ